MKIRCATAKIQCTPQNNFFLILKISKYIHSQNKKTRTQKAHRKHIMKWILAKVVPHETSSHGGWSSLTQNVNHTQCQSDTSHWSLLQPSFGSPKAATPMIFLYNMDDCTPHPCLGLKMGLFLGEADIPDPHIAPTQEETSVSSKMILEKPIYLPGSSVSPPQSRWLSSQSQSLQIPLFLTCSITEY